MSRGGRLLLLLLCSSISVISLVGCKKDSNSLVPPTGGGTTGSSVSPGQRKSALEAVNQVFSTVSWADPQTAKQSLLQVLSGRPEFEASGANTDASVWARFTDGRILIVAKNRPVSDSLVMRGLKTRLPQLPGIAGGELPKSATVRVMNAMGTHFLDPLPVIISMFQAKGYKVSPVSATVDNLELVNGDGVFYLNTHGGDAILRGGATTFSVWTSTLFDTTSDKTYKQLWDNGELSYIMADVDNIPGQPGAATSETHFGITKEFVSREMSFGENSLIYIDACSSLDPDFVTACVDRSVGTTAAYAGWTNTVGSWTSGGVAYFVIDRLLGTNMDPKHHENPPQRPFTYPQILQELAKLNLNQYTDPDEHTVAEFSILPPSASFGFFAPSIEQMLVDDQNHQLRIVGLFGSDLADVKVTLNDQPLTVANRSPGELLCTLDPATQNTGGDVKVIVHNDTSNAVQLTEWLGKVQVTATLPGSVGYTIMYSFHIRGDVHAFRSDPGATPQPETIEGVWGMGDSFGFCSVGGSITDVFPLAGSGCTEKVIETWPHAEDTVHISNTGLSELTIAGDLKPQSKTLTLYLSVYVQNFITDNVQDSTFCPNSQPSGGGFSAPVPLAEYDTVFLQIDNNYNLVGTNSTHHALGMLTAYSLDPNLPLGTVAVSFTGAQVKYPPDPKAGVRPVIRHEWPTLYSAQHSIAGGMNRRKTKW